MATQYHAAKPPLSVCITPLFLSIMCKIYSTQGHQVQKSCSFAFTALHCSAPPHLSGLVSYHSALFPSNLDAPFLPQPSLHCLSWHTRYGAPSDINAVLVWKVTMLNSTLLNRSVQHMYPESALLTSMPVKLWLLFTPLSPVEPVQRGTSWILKSPHMSGNSCKILSVTSV